MSRQIFAVSLYLLAGSAIAQAADDVPASCPVTMPINSVRNTFGNDVLEVTLPARKLIFRPGGGGFVLPDGALAVKIAWNRKQAGRMRISGRRLDGPAPPLRALILDGYGGSGGQTTMVAFTTPGCWEVTGHIASGSFSFVIFVVRIGDGPEGRDNW